MIAKVFIQKYLQNSLFKVINNKWLYIITGIIICILLYLFAVPEKVKQSHIHFVEFISSVYPSKKYLEENVPLKPIKYIAHAGGSIKGLKITNSLEALENNYNKGYRAFELDFSWTMDKKLVLLHDWNDTIKNLFNTQKGQRTHKEFLELKMKNNLTQMDLKRLSLWVKDHPDVQIVTDIKKNNITGLRILKEEMGCLINQFIPQIYQFKEYGAVREMGYKHIIFTNYKLSYSPNLLKWFSNKKPLHAITIPVWEVDEKTIDMLKNGTDAYLYLHTINNKNKEIEFRDEGIDGIYTDKLID